MILKTLLVYLLIGCSCRHQCLGEGNSDDTLTLPKYGLDLKEEEEIYNCSEATHGFLLCNKSGYIESVLNCACVTYNQTTKMIEVGFCIYGCNRSPEHSYSVPPGYSALPSNISKWNEMFCGPHKREGTLCGTCQNGYYAPAYSYDMKCVQCNNSRDNIWKYLLWAFGPLTLFSFVLLFLPINIVSSKLMGFTFYCQIIALPIAVIRPELINHRDKLYIIYITRFLGAYYGIWNLDYFRTYNSGICLQTDTLATLTLDLAIATYPLVLIMLTYLMIMVYDNNFTPLVILMKPILNTLTLFKHNWNIRTSVIDSFITFTLLSSVKLLSLCIDLLTPVTVYRFDSIKNLNYTTRLYYDPTVEYFGYKHLPYGILAIFALLIFILLPILLLTLYPFRAVQKYLSLLPTRIQLFLKIFVDSFQGCYKNGTEPGTRDYRYLSAFPFIIRMIAMLIYVGLLNISFAIFASILLVVVFVFIINTEPYKKDFQCISYYWQLHILLLTTMCICFTGLDEIQMFGASQSSIIIIYIVGILVLFLPMMYSILEFVSFVFLMRKTRKNTN